MAPRACVWVSAVMLITGCFSDDHLDGPAWDDEEDEPEEEEEEEEPPEEEPCVPEAWLDEADHGGAQGVPMSFDLVGTDIEIDGGTDLVSIPAPLAFSPTGLGAPLLAFPAARVDDAHEGTLVVIGSSIYANAGGLAEVGGSMQWLDGDWVVVDLEAAIDDGARPDLGPSADPSHVDALAAAVPIDVHADGLRIYAFERAYIVTDTTTIELTDPFVVDAARMYWGSGSRVGAREVGTSIAGDVTIELDPDSGEIAGVPALPIVVLARDAELFVGPGRVRTIGDVPVRQAMSLDGALVLTDVELRVCEPAVLDLAAGDPRVLRLAYRERTGLVDAVLTGGEVKVYDDEGNEWVARMQVDRTVPAAIEAAAQRRGDASWADLVIPSDEGGGLLDAIVCLFSFLIVCPSGDDETPLAPYPMWMWPGDLGEIELEVIPISSEGEHTVTIEIAGDNYDAVATFDVVVY